MNISSRLCATAATLFLVSLSSQALAAPTNVALGKTVTGSSYYDSGSEVFPYSQVVDGRTTDTGTGYDWSFWLSAQSQVTNQWVQVDLGQLYGISSVILYDTHNRGYNDRGTENYHVALSSNGISFTTVGSGTFTNAEWLNQTADTLNLASVTNARYVRFYADSAYGSGSAGLAEIQVMGDTPVSAVPEPATAALAGLALLIPALRRKQSR